MTISEHPGTCECFSCKLRYWREARPLGLAAAAIPSRQNTATPSQANPAWERGIAGEHRRDGTFMPYIGERTMNPIRVKAFGEQRHRIEQELRRQSSDASSTKE